MPAALYLRIVLSITLVAACAGLTPACADDWPTRPVTMVVPFAAGSASDTGGRVLAAGLSEVLGQQVIVENIAGGGGMTGTARVAKAQPDGYQFTLGSVDAMAFVPGMRKQPPYNSITDFAPVGLVVDQPIVLIVRKDLPVKTMQEFATYAKANSTKMQFGSSGVGSGSYFACARLNIVLGIEPTHVPYRGSGLAIQDLMAGRIDYLCALGAAAIAPLSDGSATAIAVLTNERSPLFPDVKTAKEQGVSGAESYFWTGFFFPSGTPRNIVEKLNKATSEILSSPKTVERLNKVGLTPIVSEQRSPQYLQTFMASEVDAWGKVIKASGIPIE